MNAEDRDLLMSIDRKVERIDERTEMHGRQIGTIFSMLNDGGCSKGKQNATSLKWLWLMFLGGFGALSIVIGYFHAR